ncbi:4'-phosphopantetheinyl transferase superfamily protein [Staphylococcus xylosus]|nr:4'-phosphopantetheinyl transferase superfamily protein [Staphylococcus xylosus]
MNDAQSSISRFNRFFEVWTMKECYLKLLGIGMYKALDSFSITPVQGRYQLVETEDEMMHRCSFFMILCMGSMHYQ